MNSLLFSRPRLPDRPVKMALVSGEYLWIARSLQKRGICTLETAPDPRLPSPVQFHPDMQLCMLGAEHIFVLQGSPLKETLAVQGVKAVETEKEPEPNYPKDVLCNAFLLGNFFVGNPASIDHAILKAAAQMGFHKLSVRQGYAACAVALVNKFSAITADLGIARVLERQGFDILRIRPGFITLPGYDTGLIGGCCGKLAPDVMAFTGCLDSHPDGGRIREFLNAREIEAVELKEQELFDIGGILPLQ